MNDVLLVAVLHGRYDLYEENKHSLVTCLLFSDCDKGCGGGGDVVDADRKDET